MSDSHHLASNLSGSVHPVGEVNHIHFLSEDIGSLCLLDEYSDVTLIVENTKFKVHKVILAARSEYFRALLFGGLKETQQSVIELKGTSLTSFRLLIKYIYSGCLSLACLKDEVILDVFSLSHQYGFGELERAISDYLTAVLNISNVCMIYDMANLFQLQSLASICCAYIDRHASEILKHDSFLALSATALKDMISRDSFCAKEVVIFQAVCQWIRQNPDVDASDILRAIRLPLIKIPDLLNVVRPTALLDPDRILDAIKAKVESKDTDLCYRGYMLAEENMAQPRHGALVTHGEMRAALLDGDTSTYDMERGFTRHPIDETDGSQKGIVVKLGKPCIINHIRLLLWDLDARSYAYYIEVSMDQKDWVKVVDHHNYFCRSMQKLYFPPRVVHYIRIVGTLNTVNRVFHAVAFECMYTNKPFKVENGLLVPKENVATTTNNACVPEGVSRNRNALLNGDIQNYDWDSGYTCHQLGSGSIVVQLAQPYMIDSIRLLLWDCDDRSYSFYVEVSTDQSTWEIVADKSTEPCKSWQTIYFRRRPLSFIRIVGTHNTANEVFHCVHFECPAQVHDNTKAITPDVAEAESVLPQHPQGQAENQKCKRPVPTA